MIKAVLFDLDGTLIDSIKMHFNVEKKSYKNVYGIDLTRKIWISAMGFPEPEFCAFLCRKCKVPDKLAQDKYPDLLRARNSGLREYILNRPLPLCPGANELLAELKHLGKKIGLVTGNAKSTGSYLLEKSSLKPYFDADCYSDNVKDRAELVANAIAKINSLSKNKFKNEEFLVVGDTVHDIASAKENGCLSLGVCTGFAKRGNFEKAGADHVLDNLKNKDKFLSLL